MVSTAGQLLEREPQLGRIGVLLNRARVGVGGVALVDAAAGIDTTRCAPAAREEGEVRGFLVLAARGIELEREYPFGVVRQLFEQPLRTATDEHRAQLFEGAAALAARAVLPELAVPGGASDPAFSLLHGLFWLCANIAEQQPLLLVVDDLQWVDEASVRFFGFLAHRIDALTILLLITQRNGARSTLNLPDLPVERVSLQPLSRPAVTSFLRVRVDGEVEERFAAACHAATGGNPFLLVQLLQALRERGVPFTAANTSQIEAVGPEGISAAVRERLGRLGSAASELARAAAVLGDDTQLLFVAELAGIDEAVAAEAAASLAGAGVLEEARPLRFEHPIVRAAVEAGLTAVQRASLHRRAAQLLVDRDAPVDEIAMHLLQTEPDSQSWVAETLAGAAQAAAARGAPEAAVAMLARALAEPPAAGERSRLLLELGRAESALGRPEAFGHLKEAHRLSADPWERGRSALALVWLNARAPSDGDLLGQLVDEAIVDAEPVDHELALELEAARAAILSATPTRAAEAGKRLERFADLKGRTRAECALLAHLAHFRMDAGSSAADAAELAERAVANERVIAEIAFDAPWLLSAILVLRLADRNELALETLARALAVAERGGSISGFALTSVLRASVLLRRGDIDGAEADARAGLDTVPPSSWSRLPALGMLIEVLIEQQRLDEAHQLLVAHQVEGDLPDFRPATVLLLSRAALRAEAGAHAPALADLDRARSRLARYGDQNVVGLDGRIRAALARHALGDEETAHAEAEAALAVARRWGTPAAFGTALRAHAIVTGGEDGLAQLHEAADQLERSPRRLEHARVLVDLGAALRRRGDRLAARQPLRQALVRTPARTNGRLTGIRR
jgi:tetratricopeptide (TPR) repeat protein